MNHQSRQNPLSLIEPGLVTIHGKAGMDKSGDSLIIHRDDQAFTVKVRLGAGEEFKHIAGESFSRVPTERTRMPQLVQLRRVGIVKGTILHWRIVPVSGRGATGVETWELRGLLSPGGWKFRI